MVKALKKGKLEIVVKELKTGDWGIRYTFKTSELTVPMNSCWLLKNLQVALFCVNLSIAFFM